MNSTTQPKTRQIARAAVRTQLADAALNLFLDRGFEQVTVNDIAAAAGVSPSTVVRYLGTKEEPVLSTFEHSYQQMATVLRARPGDEDDWTALRRALVEAVTEDEESPRRMLQLCRLIGSTPSLAAGVLSKQWALEASLSEALARRAATALTMRHRVTSAAALACLNIATDYWIHGDGEHGLAELLDRAFTHLAPTADTDPITRNRTPRSASTPPGKKST